MLTVQGLTKHFGANTVLQGVNFVLKPGQRVALVGRNGSGKSTLMRILCGQMSADGGHVSLVEGFRLGYLEQDGQLPGELGLYDAMRSCFAEVDSLEQQVRQLEEKLAQAPTEQSESLLNTYDQLQNRWLHAQPELIDGRIRSILFGLGFSPDDLNKRCGHFSGGWQMRAALAQLLLDLPDILLLDEPTNHLDVEAVEWLEEFLCKFSGSLLLVSHDRYFLDRVCNRTLELDQGELEDFSGNYTYYEEESARRYEQQVAAYRSQQKKLQQEMRFVERFRYKASLASRVQSRLKLIQKRQRVEMPDETENSIRLSFVPALDSGREVMTGRSICKSYGPQSVLKGVNFKIERGDRIALVGPNGSGKSTLLRILCGQEDPDSGKVNPGYRLSLVYFAQKQADSLRFGNTILEEVQASAPQGSSLSSLRSLLGGLLFSGDSVYKKVEVLSGGERGRVALARCLATPSNFLALDEPTNHLDIDARENLLEALEQYPGTLLLISHDRYFIERLATRVWEMRDGQLRSHEGGYADYRRTLILEAKQVEQAGLERQRKEQEEQRKRAQEFRSNARQARAQEPRTHHWTLEALEKKIEGLESELKEISARMGEPEVYREPALAQKLQKQFDQLQAECQGLMHIWEEMLS